MPCKCCEAVRFHRKLDGFIHFQRIFLPHALKYALPCASSAPLGWTGGFAGGQISSAALHLSMQRAVYADEPVLNAGVG